MKILLKDQAFAELQEYMQGSACSNRKEVLYDYLVEYYACAGFDEAFGELHFSGLSEDDLLEHYLSLFTVDSEDLYRYKG